MYDPRKSRTDVNKEQNGVLIDYVGGSKLLIARENSKNYQRKLRELATNKYAQRIQETSDDTEAGAEVFEELTAETYAHTVLLDIQGMAHPYELNEDGSLKPLEYTPELGFRMLRDPAYHDFYEVVKKNAGSPMNFREAEKQKEVVAEEVKTIASPSTATE